MAAIDQSLAAVNMARVVVFAPQRIVRAAYLHSDPNYTGYACADCRAPIQPLQEAWDVCGVCKRNLKRVPGGDCGCPEPCDCEPLVCAGCGAGDDVPDAHLVGACCDRCGLVAAPVDLRVEARESAAERERETRQ